MMRPIVVMQIDDGEYVYPKDPYYSMSIVNELSEMATAVELEPAVALRTLRREQPILWWELFHGKVTLSEIDILYVFEDMFDAHEELEGQLIAKQTQRPEHFLLQTNLAKFYEMYSPLVAPADIHFIRTQRRYNKRRYARVRAVSRPSFWSGMLLSALATGAFWGASAQNLEWIINSTVVTDINTLLLILYLFIFQRLLRQARATSAPYSREQNKSRRGIANFLRRPKSVPILW